MIMTENEYKEHCNDYDGYCTKCDEVTNFGCTEPDARKYICEVCEDDTVYGIEESLLMGWIEIIEDNN